MMIWTAHDALLREMGMLYDAKQRFLAAQEEMAAQAHDPSLARCLRQHLQQTGQHSANLDRLIQLLSEQNVGVTSHTARGVAEDVRAAMDEARTLAIRDWLIASSATTIEQAEIGFYGSLITAARVLGLPQEGVDLLQQNLGQDQQTAQDLGNLAPALLNAALRAEGHQ
jgi:ferritin-like metal-binding protein YciE